MIETINISDIDQLEVPQNNNITLQILNITFLIILIITIIVLIIYKKNQPYYTPILTTFSVIALIVFYNIVKHKSFYNLLLKCKIFK